MGALRSGDILKDFSLPVALKKQQDVGGNVERHSHDEEQEVVASDDPVAPLLGTDVKT